MQPVSTFLLEEMGRSTRVWWGRAGWAGIWPTLLAISHNEEEGDSEFFLSFYT